MWRVICGFMLSVMLLAAPPVRAREYNFPELSPTFTMLLGPSPKSCWYIPFVDWVRCSVDIEVGPGYTDENHIYYPDACHAIFPFSGFEVSRHAKRLLVWRIIHEPSSVDPHSYQFPNSGAIILKPADGNDPALDLDEPDFDGAVTNFKMKDRNLRIREIHFDFTVVRDDGQKCISGDPVIINKGD